MTEPRDERIQDAQEYECGEEQESDGLDLDSGLAALRGGQALS